MEEELTLQEQGYKLATRFLNSAGEVISEGQLRRHKCSLVNQDYAVWFPTDIFSQLTALTMTNVSWWRSDEARDGVFLGILARIDADHSVRGVEQQSRQLLKRIY